jgi:acyl carrier protein
VKLDQLISTVIPATTADEIRPSDRLGEDLGMDSLEVADLLVSIETHFGVVITAPMLAHIRTVADLESAIALATCGVE